MDVMCLMAQSGNWTESWVGKEKQVKLEHKAIRFPELQMDSKQINFLS